MYKIILLEWVPDGMFPGGPSVTIYANLFFHSLWQVVIFQVKYLEVATAFFLLFE